MFNHKKTFFSKQTDNLFRLVNAFSVIFVEFPSLFDSFKSTATMHILFIFQHPSLLTEIPHCCGAHMPSLLVFSQHSLHCTKLD